MANDDYKSFRKQFSDILWFPVNIVLKFFIFLLGLALIALILYFVIKLLLWIVGGLVVIFSMLAGGGGIIKILLDEAKNEAADSSKKTIAGYLLPFIFKKKAK